MWFSVGYNLDVCSLIVLHELQVNDLFHNYFCSGLQGNLCSSTWSTYSNSFTDLGFCRVIFSTFFPFFSLTAAVWCFYPFWSMLSQSCHQHYWWVQLWPGVSPFWNDCIQRRGTSWSLLPGATPPAHPLPKPCHVNPIKFIISALPKLSSLSFPRKRPITCVINWNKKN